MTDYESVDFFTDEEIAKDPFPYFEYLRAKCPVQPTGHRGVVAVTGYEEAMQVYRDTETFSSCNGASGPFLSFPVPLDDGADVGEIIERHRDVIPQNNLLVTLDQPRHTRERALLMRLITPVRLRENKEFIRRLADRHIDRFLPAGRCDFVRDCAQPFSMLVIADLLGVPEADHQRFRRNFGLRPEDCATEAAEAAPEGADTVNSLSWLYSWFEGYVQDRRREPRDDVLTELAQAKYPDGTTPDVTAVVHLATFLFAAGGESTADMLAIAITYLARYPELQDNLRGAPSRIAGFVEECLRVETPVPVNFRLAKRATALAGVDIAPGTTMAIFNGAVSRDPRRFDSRAEFAADRRNAREHIAFGRGIHSCPGAPLARAEGQVLIERLLDRTRNIRLSEEHHGSAEAPRFEYKPALTQRSLLRLHVEFDPSETR